MLSELDALTQGCASLSLYGGGEMRMFFKTGSAVVAKRIYLLLKKRLDINATLHYAKLPQFGGQRVHTLLLDRPDTRKLLLSLRMLRPSQDGSQAFRGASRRALTRRCCQLAFLRGAFLGAGTVNTPGHGYHLEMICQNEARAEQLSRIMRKNGLSPKRAQRRGQTLLYLKDADEIATLLGLMGAPQALLHLQNIRASRSLHNRLNRARNCDEGNLKRLLAGAQKQVTDIAKISLSRGLTSLPQELSALARLRLANPDATLQALGEMSTPAISKSCVNHRMRRLSAIAADIDKATEDENHD